jgi:hypothetical protein
MAGFVGCNGEPTTFDVTLDHVTTDLSITQVTRFGEQVRGSGRVFAQESLTRAVHCGSFYDRLQNPDYAFYRTVRADSLRSIYLYLTDGVQSDVSGSSQSPSVAELKQWVADGNALAILAFRSGFSGQAWSEQRQRMIGSVSVDDRPFYLFVFAPTEAALDRTLGRLSSSTVRGAEITRFGHASVRCSARAARRLPKYTWKETPPWAMVKLTSEGALIGHLLDYRCQLANGYPLRAVLPRLSIGYRRWSGNAFSERTSPGGATDLTADSVEFAGRESIVHVAGTLPFDNSSRYGFYEIRMDADPGELKAEVRSLSTDSDASVEAFKQTYRFSWLIEQLARVHLGSTSWTPYTITVQYR